jgi:hypothetical protein
LAVSVHTFGSLFPASEFPSLAECLELVNRHYQATDPTLVDKIHIQHSGVVQFVREFRCFIADGEVTASSFYLETVRDDSGSVISDTGWQAMDESTARESAAKAALFAAEVIGSLECAPAGYTLDVGQLVDGSWAVVEANAAWSSNPYHSDPAGAIMSILASQRPDSGAGKLFRWAPEEAFLSRVNPFRL